MWKKCMKKLVKYYWKIKENAASSSWRIPALVYCWNKLTAEYLHSPMSEIKLHRIKEILGQQIASSIWKNLQTDSSYSLLDYKKGDLACQPGNSKEKWIHNQRKDHIADALIEDTAYICLQDPEAMECLRGWDMFGSVTWSMCQGKH